MRNAVIRTSTGSVLRYGYADFSGDGAFDAATETQLALNESAIEPEGVPLKYIKVVAGEFVEMSPAEKAAVDAVTAVGHVLRKLQFDEITVADGGTDTSTGFTSVFGAALQVPPLKAGDWQLIATFELALVAGASWSGTGPDRAAQARLMWNGAEIATWLNPHAHYLTLSASFGATLTEGETPTLDLQIRRFGVAGSARVRRVRLELAPTVAAATI